jgi:hypothetical protein
VLGIEPDAGVAVADGEPQRETPEPTPYAQALSELETQLGQLEAAFAHLDTLRTEEAELAASCEQIAAEERAILENPNGVEKSVVEKLLRVRATRDIRDTKLANMRKRIVGHIDLILFDIGEPLRAAMSNLAHVLSGVRRQRITDLFVSLLGTSADHGLPVSIEILVWRSKPMIAAQQLTNWIDAEVPTQEEKLARSEVPQRWLQGLRRIAQEEVTT